MVVYVAEDINTYLAKNYKVFTKHQYFDSPGLFISVIMSMPFLFDTCIIIVTLNYFVIN